MGIKEIENQIKVNIYIQFQQLLLSLQNIYINIGYLVENFHYDNR